MSASAFATIGAMVTNTPASIRNYVINLDRSKDRLDTFQARAAERGLVFQRVPAVEGAAISDSEFDAWHAKCRLWAPMTRTEVACFLSHRKAWDLVLAGAEPWAFVAEDDIVFAPGAEQFFSSLSWLPTDLHIVKAETIGQRVEMSSKVHARHCGFVVRVLKSQHDGSAGYFVSREGAQRLLECSETQCEPADFIIFNPGIAASSGLQIGQIEPALCMQDFHFLPPTVDRRDFNTIGHIPRKAEEKLLPKKRSLSARLSRRIDRSRQSLRRAMLTLFQRSVFRRVTMNS